MTWPPAALPMAAAALAGVLVGASIVATRFVIDQIDPVPLALLRYVIGFLCLLPLAVSVQRVRFARRDVLPIALLGIAQFGILVVLLNIGLQVVPSGRAALIFATLPLLAMLLSAALGHETMTAARSLGVLATLVGVGLVLGEQALAGTGSAREWLGAAAVFASAFCGALCSVLYRPYLKLYPALPVGALAMLASVGFLALLSAGQGALGQIANVTTAGWLAVGFIGVGSGLGYFLWLWALGQVSATKVTVFLALSPPTAALLGAMLLDEPVPALLWLGVACVALGLWLANRRDSVAGLSG